MQLRDGPLGVGIELDPLQIAVERDGRPLIGDLSVWAVEGTVHDNFVLWTEGVMAEERHEPVARCRRARIESADDVSASLVGELEGGRGFRLRVGFGAGGRILLELEVDPGALRAGVRWEGSASTHWVGTGARHHTSLDQAGRSIRLGCDRRYTGPDCPDEFAETGGIPQADCASVPWLLSDAGFAIWIDGYGDGILFELGERPAVSGRTAAGPLRLQLLTDPTPAALLRRYCELTGFPALLPEWAYGHWKSRDVYPHQSAVEEDFEGYLDNELPLDAIVLDSPWETQYNTWEFNPHQFPDAQGMIDRMRSSGVRTVVWVTPWVNVESSEGQRPPDAESERLHTQPASNYADGERSGHYVRDADGDPLLARWWMGTGSPVDFTSPDAERWWREMAKRVIEMGVDGIKADDGDGYYIPPDARFADGSRGAEAAWRWGGMYRESMQRALDEAAPGSGVLFGRSGWSGQQRLGLLWGGDQASDFWSLRVLVAATLNAALSGFSNWSHDIGGYLGRQLVERCPKELLIRWLQFGCFTPLMQAHGRFEQEAWTYDPETLEIYRRYVLLHERLVPYIRAAAAGAARSGLPIIRPLCLTDPGDPRGFEIADSYGFGPALWVAPVLEEGAAERAVELPRGEWIDYWSGEHASGGALITAAAPLERIPVWVRCGSILVTYPDEQVAAGLGDQPEGERPLQATLWGEPRLGRATVRLADGTRLGWHRGEWWVDGERVVAFAERP